MTMRRKPILLSSKDYFEPGIPVFVNRAYETFELQEHAHEFIEITYVSEGEGVHYIDGESVPVEQGTLFYIPVGLSHVFRPRTIKKDRPLIVYNCLFPAEYLKELLSSFPQLQEVLHIFSDPQLGWFEMKDTNGDYHSLFRELYREYTGRPPGYLAVLGSIIVRIITGLYRQRMRHQLSPGEKSQWMTIEETIAYIDRNYAEDLRLGDIASQASLSERQFSRLFHRQTGMSFTAYIQNIRMEAACQLLMHNRMQITDIAAAVGYSDMKYFHQLFKRKTGVTPRAYRKLHS